MREARINIIQRVAITENMRVAILSSVRQGVLNKSTLVSGEGNLAGRAGEVLVQEYLPDLVPASAGQDRKGWDFVDVNGTRFDVKSKGNVKYPPRPDFDCTVPEYQATLECDAYIFVRVAADLSCGYIMGYIPKAEFLAKARIREAGSFYNNSGRTTVGNHLVVLASELNPISELK